MNMKQTGFSLVELIIAMLISLILVFACSSLYSTLKSSIKLAQDLSTSQESLRGSFYLLSRSIRQAQSFIIVSGGTKLTTIYGTKPAGIDIYNCLGKNIVSGNTDTYRSDGDYLYCHDGNDEEKIALGVTKLEFEDASTSAAIGTGVKVTMKINGMPASYVNGFSFELALRQKILLDIEN